MSEKCKKKQVVKSPHRDKMNKLKTLQNKRARLFKQVANNPHDLSACNALNQVDYDLKHGKF